MLSRRALRAGTCTHAARFLSLTHPVSSTGSRAFATAVESKPAPTYIGDASGIKVAAVDYGRPSSAVTVLVKAGSRFQTKDGLANVLKNFAFKSTGKRSAIGTVREAELYGGLLSASLTREHLALTAEFLRGDESFFVDVLSSFITSARFTRHELEEYVLPLVSSDSQGALLNPATRALEAAHELAFRSGLGASLFAPPSGHGHSITVADIKTFASDAFKKGNIAIIGTNIESEVLMKLVEENFAGAVAGTSSAPPASKYFGGSTRLPAAEGPQTLFIGFGTSSGSSVSQAELATLAAYLSPAPSVRWSKGLSPLSNVLPEGTNVQAVYLPYSDASLVGLLVQGRTAADVREAGKACAEALKKVAASGAKSEEVQAAIKKAKFGVAHLIETREGLINVLGSKIFAGSETSLESTISAFDSVTPASFSKAMSSLASSRPTFVAVGDTYNLPHVDELGF